MKILTHFETRVIAGGVAVVNEQNTEKVKVEIHDGLDDDADSWDKLARKFHDRVEYHRC